VTAPTTSADLGERPGAAAGELAYLAREGKEISSQAAEIVRGDLELAIAEVRDGIDSTVRAGTMAIAAIAFGAIAFFWAFATLFFGLSVWFEPWAAALITLGAGLLLTAIFGLVAISRFGKISFVPRRAVKAVTEDKQWLQEQLRSSMSSTGAAKP